MWARLKAGLIIVAILAVFAGGLAASRLIKTSPYFRLQRIQVALEGARFLDKAKIIKLSGLVLGQNLFEIDLDQVKRRLEQDPWVAEVFVARKYPDTIYLKVYEEAPVAMVATPKGIWLVNRKGVLFARAPRQLLKELPALVGLSKEEIKRRRLSASRSAALDLLAWLKGKEDVVPPYANISQLKFEPDGFWLLTRDALRIRFSGNTSPELRQAYRKLDCILVYLYETDQYARVRVVRLDYPADKAAFAFKKARRKS